MQIRPENIQLCGVRLKDWAKSLLEQRFVPLLVISGYDRTMLSMEQEKVSSAEQLKESLLAVCGDAFADGLVASIAIELGDVVVTVSPAALGDLLKKCKELPQFAFNMLIDITAVDWLDGRDPRFDVVYQLLSLTKKHRLTIKVPVSEDRPEVVTATNLWNGANFLEREVWDMFGIRFTGHPDLRRILMYDEFVGHPLRKDYPLQGKQPRVPLRYPEVENTARRMHRDDLVTIRSRKSSGVADDRQGA
jgi:NADH-quinone oxidoreductase subunit C